MQELVWLDCDPGHDDAMAIMLAGYNPKIKLLGISTSCGNQTVEKTTLNALKILTVSGLEHIDVVKGQPRPLVQQPKICPEIHGTTGLDGPEFPQVTKKPIEQKAIIHMFNVINAQKEKVNLVCTCALTNVALLLTVYPEVKEKLKQIVIMGGAIGIGNTSPAAEFNIECDPEAAKIVFGAGVKLVMVPLEVTHTCLVTSEILDIIKKMNTKFSKLIIDLLLFFKESYLTVFKFKDPPLHDPCAIAYVINPNLFTTELMRVDIETSSKFCNGRTVCDIYHMSKEKKNCIVATKMDVKGFWELMISAISDADKVSILNK